MNTLDGFYMVSEVVLFRNDKGDIELFYPELNYKNIKNIKLHEFGNGPFCKFRISDEWINREGIYTLVDEDNIFYIGETVNLYNRFNSGYGSISPRNCFIGGQSTNCRINKYILEHRLNNQKLYVYFLESKNRKNIEASMIEQFHPNWNISGNINWGKHKHSLVNEQKITINEESKKSHERIEGVERMYKYLELEKFLSSCKDPFVKLTYDQIETMIHNNLPKSAYSYSAWWANNVKGHTHARAWMESGYKVHSLLIGESVEFAKQDGK